MDATLAESFDERPGRTRERYGAVTFRDATLAESSDERLRLFRQQAAEAYAARLRQLRRHPPDIEDVGVTRLRCRRCGRSLGRWEVALVDGEAVVVPPEGELGRPFAQPAFPRGRWGRAELFGLSSGPFRAAWSARRRLVLECTCRDPRGRRRQVSLTPEGLLRLVRRFGRELEV